MRTAKPKTVRAVPQQKTRSVNDQPTNKICALLRTRRTRSRYIDRFGGSGDRYTVKLEGDRH